MKRLSTKKWIVGIGSIVMAVVLVLVGTLRNVETSDAKGIFKKVEEIREEYWENGRNFTILEIIPDNGVTELAYLVGEQEPYSDGDYATETDFINLPVEEQAAIVEDLSARNILTKDETSASKYPLYYSYKSFTDAILLAETSQELIDEGYTELFGNHLVAGTFQEVVDANGNVGYQFTWDYDDETGWKVDIESKNAYLTQRDGTRLELTYNTESELYYAAGAGSGDGEDVPEATEGEAGESFEGSAVVVNASIPEKEIGKIGDTISGNEELVPFEGDEDVITMPSVNPIELDPTNPSIPEQPKAGMKEQSVQLKSFITAAGDTFEGYGYVTGYLYTKFIEEYTVTNNEFFKTYVFDMILDEREKVNVDIMTVKVSELTMEDIRSANMFYIQGGSYGVEGESADISSELSYEIIRRIAYEAPEDAGATTYTAPRTPCVIDYSVYESLNATNQNSYMYKLALMMTSTEMSDSFDYIANGEGNWDADINGNIWGTVKSYLPEEIPNGGHYVNENVYFVNNIDLVSSDFRESFSELEVATGFADVYNAIERELNDYEDSELIKGLIDPAIVFQYLLNYAEDSMIILKSQIKVLELQPCKTFNWGNTKEQKEAFIEEYSLDYTADQIEFECMTTMEFVGRNDNLNATYDLIYIGTNLDNYKREVVNVNGKESILRKWVDEDMKGLVYSHVGDLTPEGAHGDRGVGLLESDYDNATTRDPGWRQMRLPGNDISSHNMEDLIEYLQSGYPIIVSDWFFTYDGKNYTINTNGRDGIVNGEFVTGINGGNEYTVDRYNKREIVTPEQVRGGTTGANNDQTTVRYGILDTSTYLYRVVKEAWDPEKQAWNKRKYPNLINESDADSEFMTKYLNKQKLSLNLTQVPTEYSYTTQGEFDIIKDIQYLTPREDGKYILNYEFSISNLDSLATPNDKYTCQLYIDDNFDGKFSKTQEEVSELIIVEAVTGKTVAYNDLKAGVPYTLTRELPGDYVGCIQWQLLISQNSNPYIQCEEIGLTAVKSAKETINILHIMDWSGGDYANHVSVSLEEEAKKTNSVWGMALNNIPDFDINVKSITMVQYIELLERYLWEKVPYGQDISAYPTPEDFFNEYIFGDDGTDMILMGFVDVYPDIDHDVAVNAIMNYAASGRSVLFSHDMTSWKNKYRERTGNTRLLQKNADGSITPNTGNNQFVRNGESEYFGIRIREASGMDMFGVTLDRFERTSYANTGKGYSNNPQSPNYNLEAWNYLVGIGKDMAFKANTEQTETVGETSANTYVQIRGDFGGGSYIIDDYEVHDYAQKWADRKDHTLVTQVNDGVITSYPYEIPERFTPATTHSQYYCLDMEEDADQDGESDLVVWYCVAGRQSAENYTTNDLYSISPNDVRNNYYIYSMGNVIYTGMGHTVINEENDQECVEEIKLFINTMVAAYRAGVKTPDVSIVENADEGAKRTDFIALPYDETIVDDADNPVAYGDINKKEVEVFFELNDNNVIKGTKQIVAEFYIDGVERAYDNPNAMYNNMKIIDCATNNAVTAYIMDDNKCYYALESGKKYAVTLQLTEEQVEKSCEIEVRAYSRVVKKGGAVNVSEKAIDRVRVSKVDMFDLD